MVAPMLAVTPVVIDGDSAVRGIAGAGRNTGNRNVGGSQVEPRMLNLGETSWLAPDKQLGVWNRMILVVWIQFAIFVMPSTGWTRN